MRYLLSQLVPTELRELFHDEQIVHAAFTNAAVQLQEEEQAPGPGRFWSDAERDAVIARFRTVALVTATVALADALARVRNAMR